MILVLKTILNTLKSELEKMRFIAQSDSKTIKKVLWVAILDDLCEWAKYKSECDDVYKQLNQIKNNFLFENCEFDILKFVNTEFYTNVNTPQTDIEWLLTTDKNYIVPETCPDPFDIIIPGGLYDPNSIVNCAEWSRSKYSKYLTAHLKTFNSLETGKFPFSNSEIPYLTNQQRMDIYLDEVTGQYYWINENGCQFELVTQLTDEEREAIISQLRSEINPKISHEFLDENDLEGVDLLRISLTNEGNTSTNIDLTDSLDLEDVI